MSLCNLRSAATEAYFGTFTVHVELSWDLSAHLLFNTSREVTPVVFGSHTEGTAANDDHAATHLPELTSNLRLDAEPVQGG